LNPVYLCRCHKCTNNRSQSRRCKRNKTCIKSTYEIQYTLQQEIQYTLQQEICQDLDIMRKYTGNNKKQQVKLMRQLVNLHIHLQLIMISPVITIKLYSNASNYYTLFVHYENKYVIWNNYIQENKYPHKMFVKLTNAFLKTCRYVNFWLTNLSILSLPGENYSQNSSDALKVISYTCSLQ
jgi:hypothetical protein